MRIESGIKMAKFDDFLTPSGAGVKLASAGPIRAKSELLAKLASAVGAPNIADNAQAAAAVASTGSQTGVPGTPVIGQVINAADGSVAQAPQAALAATDGLINPQVQASGGDVNAMAAGSAPGVGTVSPVRVSDATGAVEDDMAIVNSVTNGAPATAEKTASLLSACASGRAMARAYADELQKVAFVNQYTDAVGILKSAGLLDGYNLVDESMDKTASAPSFSCLEKLASGADLSYADIVGAASEYVMYKQAEAAQQEEALLIDAEAEKVANDIIAQAQAELEQEKIAAIEAYNAGVADASAQAAAPAAEKTAAAGMDVETATNVLRAAGLLK